MEMEEKQIKNTCQVEKIADETEKKKPREKKSEEETLKGGGGIKKGKREKHLEGGAVETKQFVGETNLIIHRRRDRTKERRGNIWGKISI